MNKSWTVNKLLCLGKFKNGQNVVSKKDKGENNHW